MKKIASAKKSLAYTDSNNKLDSKNDNQEKVDNNNDNGDESDDEERKNLEKRESLDDFQELNYTSKDEDEDDNINTKLSITDSVKDSEILDDKDEIIMISTYIPFNPIRNKDGTFDFILTNEAIYHTLYRVIE